MNHECYMSRALQLARLGLYSTSPNPRVGCVIVKDGKIVGEGWHQKAGEPHAEVNALAMAGAQALGATAYVTLEPCSHHGRTPPCAQGLINAGITRVVGACFDPNPLVAGRGYDMLRAAGIEVITPCLEAQAIEINKGFMQRMKLNKPWVRLKLAHSLDGRTAMNSGESQWITGPEARADVQRLRAQSCAIITGADSLLIDNAAMTVRPEETGLDLPAHLWRQPLRVLIDGKQRVSQTARFFNQSGNILIAHYHPAQPWQRDEALGTLGFWQSPETPNAKVHLSALLQHLAQDGCNEVLVESGAQLAGAFIAADLVDELVLHCAPTLLGSNARPLLQLGLDTMAQQQRWHWQDVRQIGNDLKLTLRRKP